MDLKKRVAPNFTVGELIGTTHRKIDNTPDDDVLYRLTLLANTFLQPIRDKFGPIVVNSGYRSPELNKAVGGAKNSAHLYGCAADIVALNPDISVREIVSWIVNESGLPYDQVIEEYSSTSEWCHIGMLRPGHEDMPRKDALIFKDGKYTPWK